MNEPSKPKTRLILYPANIFQPLPRGSHAASAAPGGSSLPHQCFALDGPMLRPKYPLPSCASASAGSVNAAAAITATNTCFSLLIERLLSSFFDRYGTSLRTSSRLRQSFERGTDAVGHRDACRQPLDGGERFLLAVAEPDQRMDTSEADSRAGAALASTSLP